MPKYYILLLLFITVYSCNNSTGTCLNNGFHCISGEIVEHSKRCNNIEDCLDGTDEYLCHIDSKPFSEKSEIERKEFQQANCVNCNCAVTAYNIAQTNPWWQYAIVTPTDISLMTGLPGSFAGMPCNVRCVTQMTLGFYKKNRVCRGWLCCARQRACITCSNTGSCSTVTVAKRCN
jgi:hypothetical protein